MATLAPRIASAFDRAIAHNITARANEDGTWSVLSSDGSTTYTVDFTRAQHCTCPAGQYGHFCQHQAACDMGIRTSLSVSWVPASGCASCGARYYCADESAFLQRIYCPACRAGKGVN